MLDSDPSNRLLAASRITGADVLFLQVVEQIAAKHGQQTLDCATRERISALHAKFRRRCAESLERQLGREQALQSLAVLESAPLQRYLGARQAMAVAFGKQLAELQKRMGNLEI